MGVAGRTWRRFPTGELGVVCWPDLRKTTSSAPSPPNRGTGKTEAEFKENHLKESTKHLKSKTTEAPKYIQHVLHSQLTLRLINTRVQFDTTTSSGIINTESIGSTSSSGTPSTEAKRREWNPRHRDSKPGCSRGRPTL